MENGAKKLKLSVQRLKKLQTNVQAGGSKAGDHGGSVTWCYTNEVK
jgi:hypothetical protein